MSFSATSAYAGAFAPAGDIALRHDVQVLADHGVFKGPVTSWPLSWEALAADVYDADESRYPMLVRDTLLRVRARIERNTRRETFRFEAEAALAEKPMAIRGFEDTPRNDAEIAGRMTWMNDRFNVDLQVSAVDSPPDGDEVRADGSEIGVTLGNFTYAVSLTDRWWGPGWDGSLILTNNARPIPALTIRRNVYKPFETKWLSWLGPWDARLIWGEMESDRAVPNPRFFGMKFNFKPFESLEIGLSRTAQWCGEGRPCGLDTFWDLLIGNDNVNEGGVTPESEAGNQLAGFDIRWSNMWFGTPMAMYVQLIGEDEAGFLPSRNMAMGGIEFSGWAERRRWSYRVYGEVANVSCDALTNEGYNCAYNHSIYQTGYRYKGRVIGHAAENDALIGSLGLVIMTDNENRWNAVLRSGELNRGGGADPRNTLTPEPLDILSVDVSYSHGFDIGRLDVGVGYQDLDNSTTGVSNDDVRAYVQWRSTF